MKKEWQAQIAIRTTSGKIWKLVLDRTNKVIGVISNGLRWSEQKFADKFGHQRLSLVIFCERHEFELLPT